MSENITFTGFGRIRDQLVLAAVFERIPSQEKNQVETSFQKYLTEAISRCGPGSRDKQVFPGGTLYLLVDRELCCVYGMAVRSKDYPERLAFQMLNEFVTAVAASPEAKQLNILDKPGALTKTYRKLLKDLMVRYNDPSGIDKTSEVHGKVNKVKGIMRDNIEKVLATRGNISDLEEKTDALNKDAQQFHSSADALSKQLWWQKTRVTILLGLVGAVLVAYLLYMIITLVV